MHLAHGKLRLDKGGQSLPKFGLLPGTQATSARISGLGGSGAEGITVMVATLATIIKSANTGQAPAVGTTFWLHFNCFNVRYLTGSTMVSILLLYLFIVCSWGLVMTQFAQPHAIANSKIHVQDTVTKHGCPPLCLCRPWRGDRVLSPGGVWESPH